MATINNSVNERIINGVVQTGTTGGNTATLSAYDSTAAAQDTFATLTAGANPTLQVSGFNRTGSTYTNFMTVTSNTTATCDLDDSVTKAGNYIYRAGGTDVAIADGGTGLSTTPTDGQLLIGKTSTNGYALATLSAGSGISITNGSGTISIAASGGLTWSGQNANFTASVNNGYVVTSSSAVTATLPSTFSIGDTIQILMVLSSSGAVYVKPASGDSIYWGAYICANPASINTADYYGSITVVGVIANSTWSVTSIVGNFNIS